MVTAQTIQGHWNELSGRLRERWGQLTGNEWEEADGKIDRLIGVIQRKTGEAREEIQSYIEEVLASDGGQFVERARQTAEEVASRAKETASQAAERARESFRAGYEQAESAVQQHPGRSLAIAFGVGLAAGLLLGVTRR